MSQKRIGVILALLLTAGSGAVLAKDYYVRAGGGGNGSRDNPYGEIQKALNVAFSGDVIHVAEGIYYGEGGGGLYILDKPRLTLVGGYNAGFSDRNPFKYRTLLMRGVQEDSFAECQKRNHGAWHSMTMVKASYNSKGIIQGEHDHTGSVVDGFHLDGHTRLKYKGNGDLDTGIGPIGVPLVDFSKPGCKVRNCVILNSGGPGIRMIAAGTKDDPASLNEITNCIIVNTLMEAVEYRVGTYDPATGPNGGYGSLIGNTLAFVWEKNGESYGLIVGRQTKLGVENNLFAFSSGVAINNGLQNEYCRLVKNIFWNNSGGVYKYWSPNTKLTNIEDDPALLAGKDAQLTYSLSKKSEGNLSLDPRFKGIDKDFFDKFCNQIKSSGGGKVQWDSVNEWRSILGLPLIGSKGTGNINFAPVYEIDRALLLPEEGAAKACGVQTGGPFQSYQSVGAAPAKSYAPVPEAQLYNGVALAGQHIRCTVKVEKKDMSYYLPDKAPREQFDCFVAGMYPQSVFLYAARGSEAWEYLNMALTKKIPVIITGTAHDITAAYKKPRVAVVVDGAETDDE